MKNHDQIKKTYNGLSEEMKNHIAKDPKNNSVDHAIEAARIAKYSKNEQDKQIVVDAVNEHINKNSNNDNNLVTNNDIGNIHSALKGEATPNGLGTSPSNNHSTSSGNNSVTSSNNKKNTSSNNKQNISSENNNNFSCTIL